MLSARRSAISLCGSSSTCDEFARPARSRFRRLRAKGRSMQKITTWLWFDTEAEEAAEFYTSVFPDSRITDVSRYGEAGPRPEGMVMTVGFELFGREFYALNGGSNAKMREGPASRSWSRAARKKRATGTWGNSPPGGKKGPPGGGPTPPAALWRTAPPRRG